MSGSVLGMLTLAMPRFSVLGQGVYVDLIWVSHKPPLRASTHRREVSPGTECSQPSAGHLGNFRYCHSWSDVTSGEMVAQASTGRHTGLGYRQPWLQTPALSFTCDLGQDFLLLWASPMKLGCRVAVSPGLCFGTW